MPELNQLPGTPDVWRNSETGTWYIVYYVPNTDPPVPMLWEADSNALDAYFGPGVDWSTSYTANLTTAQIDAAGGLHWGNAVELANTTEDPFATWVASVEGAAQTRPWLRDPEVLALLASSLLEGRPATEAEFQATEWWQTHSAAQRQWLLLSESDPATANQLIADTIITIRDQMEAYGMYDMSDEAVEYVANKWVTGDWSETYLRHQLTNLADPGSGVEIDAGLSAIVSGADFNQDTTNVERVNELLTRWLGPVYGQWDQATVDSWASRLANESDAETELINVLKAQRLSVLPDYAEDLSYEDIAAPWRQVWSQSWGEVADETDPLFDQVLQLNDRAEAQGLLRREGLNRGNATTTQNFLTDLQRIGGKVRRTL